MAVHPPDSTFRVRPFARRRDGSEVVVGDLERQVFLALPPTGVDILDALAAGGSAGEVAARHPDIDLDDFLDVMTAEGFVAPAGADPTPAVPRERSRRSYSLNWISPGVARRLSSWPVVALLLALIGLGTGLVLADPGLLPGKETLLFPEGNYAGLTLLLVAAMLAAVTLHELAHAVVGRAAGVPVTLGFGNLMYTLVAQTDVSGLRLAPKRQRYLAFAAGVLVDLATAGLLVALLWVDHRGMLQLAAPAREFAGAFLITYLVRAAFQLQFYMRTDLYYAVATAFGARDMLADTETLLRNGLFRLTGRRSKVVDRSGLTRRERVTVRWYAAVYLIGRAGALAILLAVLLPVALVIAGQFVLLALGRPTAFSSLDFVVAGGVMLLIDGGGMYAWVRDILRGRRRRRAAAVPAAPAREEALVAA